MKFNLFKKNKINYFVVKHHNYWPYDFGTSLEKADIVFTWFEEKAAIDEWRGMGKKVVSYEHGFGSYYGYGQVGIKPYSDKYLSSGEEGKKSLIKLGVKEEDVLVIGNKNFDDIKKSKHEGNKALFVAQHWMFDVSEYNQYTFDQLKFAYPQYNWTVRTIDKSGGVTCEKVWTANVEDPNLFKDIKKNLPKYDVVFTPRYSTFCVFAELMGIPVYITDQYLSFDEGGNGKGYVVPNNQNFIKIGDKLPVPRVSNIDNFLKRPSLDLDEVLNWCLME